MAYPIVGAAALALMSACSPDPDLPPPDGGQADPGGAPEPPPRDPGSDADADTEAGGGIDAGSDAGSDFDREQPRARAEAVLGTSEADLEEGRDLRIVRRGEESRPVTMDLRPGRLNVELDDDGTGTFVVTRVVVEVPEGEMPIEVE